MTRRENLAENLLQPINPSLIIVLGIYTILWGLWVVNPFWTVFTHSPLYSVLSIGGEYVWGGIVLASGLLITRGATKPSYLNLILGSAVGFLTWLTIGIFYLLGDWASTGGITALTFATYSLLVYLNIKVNKTYFIAKVGKGLR
jgi:hypothetical protein